MLSETWDSFKNVGSNRLVQNIAVAKFVLTERSGTSLMEIMG